MKIDIQTLEISLMFISLITNSILENRDSHPDSSDRYELVLERILIYLYTEKTLQTDLVADFGAVVLRAKKSKLK